MKPLKCLALAFAVLACTSAAAQTQLELSFNKSATGYNYRVGASYFFKERFSAGAAIKFMDWYPAAVQAPYSFKSYLKPANFKESVGFSANFNYYFLKRERMFNPFVFYDFSFSRAIEVHYHEFTPNGSNESQTQYWLGERVNAIEQFIGIGVDVRLHTRLWLFAKAGVGGALFYNKPSCDDCGRSEGGIPPTFMFELGLKYNLGPSFRKTE